MPLAKPNYAFQKRQRELAKKQKKEEKLKRRMESPGQEEAPAAPDDAGGVLPVSGDAEAGSPSANGNDAKA